MQATVDQIEAYQKRISTLEHELDEMTSALSHAWDQLVPFLQDAPRQADSSQDITPIIEAAMAAIDTEMGSACLFQNSQWFAFPEHIIMPPKLLDFLKTTLKPGDAVQWRSEAQDAFDVCEWVFAPVVTGQQVVGAIGVGRRGKNRAFTAVDVRIMIRMAERAASQIVAAQLARSREREAKAQREMQIASMIQRSTQPLSSPQFPGLQIASYWEPARQVGGDAWGWSAQQDGKFAWFILDVAGKGLPAALAAMSLHTAVRMGLRMGLAPAEILHIVNEEFYDAYTQTDLMATAVIFSLDPATGMFEQANAGHPPTLVRQGKIWNRLEATAPPIGVLPELAVKPQQLPLQSNDLIICYSDGITEIDTPAGLWGDAGVLKVVPIGAMNAAAITQHIVKVAQIVNKQNEFRDDQTLVIIRLM